MPNELDNPSSPPSLRDIQTALSKVFSDPRGPRNLHDASSLAAMDLVRGDLKASVLDRVGVYADAYFLRLKEVLQGDYELLEIYLGPRRFHELVAAYLDAYPSTSPNAARVGAKMVKFLSVTPAWRLDTLALSIAQLEWAILESIYEPWVEETGMQDLTAVGDGLPDALFVTDPSVRFVDCAFTIEDQWLERAEPTLPSLQRAEKTHLIVRRGPGGYLKFFRMNAEERAVFTKLAQGQTLTQVCETVDETPAYQLAVGQLGHWLQLGLIKSMGTEASL